MKFDSFIKAHIEMFKKVRVELNNTAAVVEINEIIKRLGSLMIWVKSEKTKVLHENIRVTYENEN